MYSLKPPERQRPPSREMQVLCLGLSRSGTDSLRAALTILGYKDVYHGFVITARQREDCAFWVPLMEQKYARRYTAVRFIEWDRVLGQCEAVTDGPANVFGEELIHYYPNAKVILNRRRDIDAWYSSMQKTCLQVFSWPMWLLSWFDTRIYWLWRNFELIMHGYYYGDFNKHGKQAAKDHYSWLEQVLKKQKREHLDWSVEEGWEPLCRYLGKEVPDVPFPDGNKGGGQFEENMEEATKDLVLNAFRNMGFSLLAVVAVVLGLWYKNR